jgi:hypothetical protein
MLIELADLCSQGSAEFDHPRLVQAPLDRMGKQRVKGFLVLPLHA